VPVANIFWYDVQQYAIWADAKLPSEAQWEKAARGPNGRIYPWGDDWDDARCVNVVLNNKPVGSFPAGMSPYGAQEMVGCIWQWCADWYAAD
jgi:formylglycine-generating enzyme required for sulfatase activity